MFPIDYFRYGPIVLLLALVTFPNTVTSRPSPQQVGQRFLPGAPAVNFNDPGTQFAGLAGLGVTAFAANNILTGNDRIRVRPNVGVNFNPQTGSFSPAVTANVQVGDGPVAPTFNVGGQFDPNSNNGIPIAPVVGTGLNVGDSNGGFNPALTSNFALQNGQANAQFGAGANIGQFDLGNFGGFFGR